MGTDREVENNKGLPRDAEDDILKFEKIDVSSDTLKAMLDGILATSSETSGLEDMWSFEAS